MKAVATAMVAALALASLACCTEIGPTIRVEAGAGKSQPAWDEDRAACRSETDRTVQPYADELNADLGRDSDRIRADNDRIQRAYDGRYGSCMNARGDRVAGLAPVPTPAPAPDDAVAQAQEAFHRSRPMDAVSAAAARSVEQQVAGFRAACAGETIDVDVRPAPVSATLTARLVALTLPHGGGCFGTIGEVDYLVARRAGGWETLLSGLLHPAGTRHHGLPDFEQQGHGACTRTFSWTGSRYVASGERDC